MLLVVARGAGRGAEALVDDDGLGVTNRTEVIVDDDGSVTITTELTLTNVVGEERQGAVVRRVVFDGLSLFIPSDSGPVSVEGATLIDDIDQGDGTRRLELTFDELAGGESLTLELSFELIGAGPRSGSPVRTNPALSIFPAFGHADPGQLSITVRIPPGSDVALVGEGLIRTVDDGVVVLRLAEGVRADELSTVVVVDDPGDLVERPIRVAGHAFDLHHLPGDEWWADQVQATLESQLPVLEQMMGRSWPVDETVEIVQSLRPLLEGYEGWFDRSVNRILLGEDPGADLIAHELSHAWINEDLFVEPWITEGLAEEFSARVLAATGTEPAPVDEGGDPAVPLNEWEPAGPGRELDTVGYQASAALVRSLSEDIGWESLLEVVRSADQDLTAYPGEVPLPARTGPADWRRLLDLLDQAGADTERFISWVPTPAQRPALAARETARERYEALAASARPWSMPLGVRADLEAWRFDEAQRAMDSFEALLVRRERIEQGAAELGVRPSAALEQAAESSQQLAGVLDRADRRLDDLALIGAMVERRDAPRSVLERIGMWRVDTEADLAAARAGFESDNSEVVRTAAERDAQLFDGARERGLRRVAVVVSGLALLVIIALCVSWWRSRRSRRRAEPRPPAAEQTLRRPVGVG